MCQDFVFIIMFNLHATLWEKVLFFTFILQIRKQKYGILENFPYHKYLSTIFTLGRLEEWSVWTGVLH